MSSLAATCKAHWLAIGIGVLAISILSVPVLFPAWWQQSEIAFFYAYFKAYL
jgi:hypothetical protein